MHTENLERASLSPAEEAYALMRAKELYEDLHPETKRGAAQAAAMNRALGRGDVSAKLAPTFTAAMSAATGKSERTLQREAGIAEDLGDDILKVAGTSLRRSAGLGLMLSSGCQSETQEII
ncbi:hypothetical protein [Roseixanthobacter pseudopolyaromaticivorans]|uniref:hypothetical protein n=1 Tax=Xanthobacteraceae TaxID=335928 RepID=UPI003729AB4B